MIFNIGLLLQLAERTQETMEHALEAAFGTSLIVVTLQEMTEGDGTNRALNDSVKPIFEKQFQRIVVPVLEAIFRDFHRDDDLQQFIVGAVLDEAVEHNHDFYMSRVDMLIADSQKRADQEATAEARSRWPLN